MLLLVVDELVLAELKRDLQVTRGIGLQAKGQSSESLRWAGRMCRTASRWSAVAAAAWQGHLAIAACTVLGQACGWPSHISQLPSPSCSFWAAWHAAAGRTDTCRCGAARHCSSLPSRVVAVCAHVTAQAGTCNAHLMCDLQRHQLRLACKLWRVHLHAYTSSLSAPQATSARAAAQKQALLFCTA